MPQLPSLHDFTTGAKLKANGKRQHMQHSFWRSRVFSHTCSRTLSTPCKQNSTNQNWSQKNLGSRNSSSNMHCRVLWHKDVAHQVILRLQWLQLAWNGILRLHLPEQKEKSIESNQTSSRNFTLSSLPKNCCKLCCGATSHTFHATMLQFARPGKSSHPT